MSAVMATAWGARRLGAGTSVRRTSGRSRDSCRLRSACAKSGDWASEISRVATLRG